MKLLTMYKQATCKYMNRVKEEKKSPSNLTSPESLHNTHTPPHSLTLTHKSNETTKDGKKSQQQMYKQATSKYLNRVKEEKKSPSNLTSPESLHNTHTPPHSLTLTHKSNETTNNVQTSHVQIYESCKRRKEKPFQSNLPRVPP